MTNKVFIVEDEPDLRDTLKYNFENEGFSVEAFSNGESFVDSIQKNQPNLVILDLMLPGLSGLDVCREIRSNEKYDDISIVMLTAKSEEIDRIVKKTLYIVKEDSLDVYLVKINGFKGINDKAPLTYIYKRIEELIISKKKVDFIKNFDTEIIENAKQENIFKVFN